MEVRNEVDQSEISQQGAAIDEDRLKANQTSSTIVICDSSTDQSVEPAEMEEKSFVSSLYHFMKGRGTPIERIPHLGFKQINLWRIYKTVEKLGGYDSVTVRRLWKNVYDELGGSPGSTSAATCTRRHYERLVLPFERQLRGEEDKPLPPSKPRKQYKRNLDGKVRKPAVKRKSTPSVTEMDPESNASGRPKTADYCETETHAHSTPRAVTSDRPHRDCSPPKQEADDVCDSVYGWSQLVQIPSSCTWNGHTPSAAGEVISPLEKKKRVAQASLQLPLSPPGDDKDRPSVIHCSPPTASASTSQNCNSSEGSPLPLSSSSSRSPSPCSVSSEDCPALADYKPSSNSKLPQTPSSITSKASSCSNESKSLSSGATSKQLSGEHKEVSHVSSRSPNADSTKSQTKDCVWKPAHKGNGKNSAPCPRSTSSCFHPSVFRSDWAPTYGSSFTKVVPKNLQPFRPTPFPPACSLLGQGRLISSNDSLNCAKTVHNLAPWFYQTEKRERSKTMPAKHFSTQQSLSHSSATLPVTHPPMGSDRAGKNSHHEPPPQPAFIPSRMRLPYFQPVYHQIPVGPTHPAITGSAIYSYPYFSTWSPQPGYTIPSTNSVYPYKL
ncbi:AT-rich interactive domain-containing protein 5A [Lampris incognitus]|uniref:AT-rich interactive domain-containing protein 5A n=1 Tax=Lampris incognitus TaxID=2546036 RepID=UPI0024B48814|nr:AT-rich interactive domain-containing protein 5A [Lampris incognitus]